MKVIGAGVGRTGTMSLKVALEQLGLGPCFHGRHVLDHPDRLPTWLAAAAGEQVDWAALFAGYRSTMDWPGAAFWRELVTAFPDAKVILTLREPQSWYDSVARTIYPMFGSRTDPRAAEARRTVPGLDVMTHFTRRVIWDGGFFGGRFEDRDHALAVFEAHNDAVQREVPPDRLLVCGADVGWAALCDFLGVAVPDEPYPHLNDPAGFWGRVEARMAEARRGRVGLMGLAAGVVSLRMWLFARLNGQEGIAIPGELVDATRFKEVYAHPAANGRSRGAALSDLFWYWLSPGAEVHQEHMEPGLSYDEVAHTTRRILSVSNAEAEALARRTTAEVCAAIGRAPATVRLRDLMMPAWAAFFADIVFGGSPPAGTRELVVANANDVITALKCCGLRHMDRRDRLTQFLVDHLDAVPHELPSCLSRREQALYLQGTFFNTAVVQTSEAMAHLLLVLAQHQPLQEALATEPDDRRLLDQVMDETMRLYPLFGIAHRITSSEIVVDGTTLPAGAVLCFNYPAFHQAGFEHPEQFDPQRWDRCTARDSNYIPFGVPGNRPCPAWHLAPIAMRASVREVLHRFELHSSAGHTRSIPNRGPCVLVPRTADGAAARPPRTALAWMRVRDRGEDVGRSVVQLVLGTYMVWDARRQRLCQRHFEDRASAGPPGRDGVRRSLTDTRQQT